MKLRILCGVAVFALFCAVLFLPRALAAAPQILLTWHAQTYVPSGFLGKALPTTNSTVSASLEIIDGGKVADVSGATVYWYLNDELAQGGAGLKNLTFRTPPVPTAATDLRVEIPNYKGAYLVKTVEVPTVSPEAVVDAPYPDGVFSQNAARVTALPYFFNVASPNQLTYVWQINGNPPDTAGDPRVLDVSVPPGTAGGFPISITLSLSNAATSAENALGQKTLTYTP